MIDENLWSTIVSKKLRENNDVFFPTFTYGVNAPTEPKKKNWAMKTTIDHIMYYVAICGVEGVPKVEIKKVNGEMTVCFSECKINEENPFSPPQEDLKIKLINIDALDYDKASKSTEWGTLIIKIPYKSEKDQNRVITF